MSLRNLKKFQPSESLLAALSFSRVEPAILMLDRMRDMSLDDVVAELGRLIEIDRSYACILTPDILYMWMVYGFLPVYDRFGLEKLEPVEGV